VLVAGFAAGALATNTWLVAAGPGQPCVIVDLGDSAAGWLPGALAEHDLTPAAALLSHGHFDHTADAAAVCATYDIPAWIHPDDRAQVADPWRGIGAAPGTPIMGRTDFAEPADLRSTADGEVLAVAGLEITVLHLPGHTPGAVGYLLSGGDGPVLLSGDVLFAGSIGRCDLPGGSEATMMASLREKVLPLPDATAVHPGHGPSSTMARERASNPYLGLAAEGRDAL